MKKILLTTTTLICLIYNNCFSQNDQKKNIYNYFDSIVDISNTVLAHGSKFESTYRKIKSKSHNYYLHDEFSAGEVTYVNEPFFDVQLKYDIVDDALISFINSKNQNFTIVLKKNLVTDFKIYNTYFINAPIYGFLEVINQTNSISLYKKHYKEKSKKLNQNFSYYSFEKREKYIISFKGVFHIITDKNDIIKVFPSHKDFINDFFKNQKYLLKNDYQSFISKLILDLNKRIK